LDVDGRCVAFDGHASILDACEDAGVARASDCRSGTCGLCRLAVLSGQVAHVLESELALPPGFVLACCAVPRSDLRLATAAA
jgi:ferredoxin